MRRRAALAMAGAAGASAVAGVAVSWRRGALRATDSQGPATADIWSTAVSRPDGSPMPLVALRGRPLLANFWATWCQPCITELPLLDRFHAAANGWQVVALALDSAPNVQRFLAKAPLKMPVGVLDAGAYDLPRRLGNASGGLPFSVVFDTAGRIAVRHLGAVDQPTLDAWVSSLN